MNNPADKFNEAFQLAGSGQGQYPFLYPTPYAPAQFGLGNSDMGALVAMFAGPLMQAMAGPGNFVPHLMPTQNVMDQYAMKNYQQAMLTSSLDVAQGAKGPVAERLLGLRSAFTRDPVTQLNREQADTAAAVMTHPIVKAIASSIVGPETLEAAMYGSKGDITALNSSIAKTGFFRTDPMGGARMTADSLTAYTEGVYSHLYEPEGNLDAIEGDARSKRGINPMRNARIDEARQKLKDLAGKSGADIVTDEETVNRLMGMDNSTAEISRLYKKYNSNGTAVTAEEQAKELVKFNRAVEEAGVIKDGEATFGQLRRDAERAPVNRMHGFMAGQVGEMQQALFERGLLPQSVGDMSTDDRLREVGGTTRDEETINRLAKTMVRKELEKTDPAFKSLSSEQQERLIDTKMPDAVKTLRDTEKETAKYARGDSDAMSIEDLEKQGGMDLLTVDTDASRAAGTLEKYSGALGAIRDLFGDNGNPNAPVPALLKMLDGLTNSTSGQFEPGRIEAELRKMQTLAKETGVGLQQLSQLSHNVTMQGRMFGLSDATAVQATNATLAGIQVMQQQGAFTTGRFGAMNKEQAMDTLGQQVQAGAGSNNGKAMATLARLYEADPKKYAGTELEAAVQAYKDPYSEGVYVDPVSGEERNLYENVGKYGPGAARQILSNSNNGDTTSFDPMFYDPLTEEYTLQNKTAGYMTQAVEGRRMSEVAARSVTYAKLEQDNKLFSGTSSEERGRRFDAATSVVNQMVIDTGDMSREKRNKYFDEHLEVEVAQKLKDAGVPDAEAEAQAKEFAGRFKTDPSLIEDYAAISSAELSRTTGLNLTQFSQLYARGKAHDFAQASDRAQKRADAKKAANLGYESGPMARASDYFADINKTGEDFTMSGLMDAVMPKIKDTELGQKFMKDMEPGFKALYDEKKDVFVTEEYVDELARNKNYDTLMDLADKSGNLKKNKTQILSGRALETARKKVLDERYKKEDGTVDDDAITRAYTSLIGGKGEGLSTEEKLQELRTNDEFMKTVDADVRAGGNVMTEDQLVAEARNAKGAARAGKEAEAERLSHIQEAFFYGKDSEKTKAGVTAALRHFNVKFDDKQIKEYHDLVLDSSEEGKRKLNERIDQDISGWGLNNEDTDKLRSILNAQQEARKLDPAAMGLTDETAGPLKQTDSGVVDQTSIDAQTVVLHGARFVDENGKEFSFSGGREEASAVSPAIRDFANKMVTEQYSKVGFLGNSSPFSDKEVEDAALQLSDTLGISRESAKTIMKDIQTERAQNSSGIGLGYLVGDETSYSDNKTQEQKKQAKDVIASQLGEKKIASRGDVDAAAKRLSAAAKIPMSEARAVILQQLDDQQIKTDAKPTDTTTAEKPKPDQVAEKPKKPPVDPAKETARATAAVYEQASVKATTGVAYERPSKTEAEKLLAASGAASTVMADHSAVYADRRLGAGREAGSIPLVSDKTARELAAAGSNVPRGADAGRLESAGGAAGIEQVVRQLTARSEVGGAGGNQEVRVSGTLSLNGLQEAMLAAKGERSVQVDNGAPIVGDPPGMYSSPGSAGRA